MTKKLTITVILAYMLTAHTAMADAPFAVGLAHILGSGERDGCLAASKKTYMGQDITLVDIDGQAAHAARLTKAKCHGQNDTKLEGAGSDLGYTVFAWPEKSGDASVMMAFPASVSPQWKPYPAVAYEGKTYGIARCTSAEGIHYTLWDGKPYASKLLHDAYYYLGYDAQANCPENMGMTAK